MGYQGKGQTGRGGGDINMPNADKNTQLAMFIVSHLDSALCLECKREIDRLRQVWEADRLAHAEHTIKLQERAREEQERLSDL